ncbi:lipoprotein [soil metagenome]
MRFWRNARLDSFQTQREGCGIGHSLGDRLRYAFDNVMARGTVALIIALFLASTLMIVGIALAVTVLGGLDDEATAGVDFVELSWMALMRTLDPGTMADDAGSIVFVLGMFSATIGGLLFVAILIGLVTSGIEGRLSELRRGRSRVMERDHTIILGWSAQVFTLVEELVEANANKRNQRIVVLAERDKVEMEDELRLRIRDTRTTRVVCRSGSPIDPADIDICSPQTSRSIIVLASGDDSDADVIKTLLAISNSPTRRARPYQLVAEIHEPSNLHVAHLASRGEARLVLVGDLIGRIAAQACRQPGLSVVYEELLDFAGDEMYFVAHGGLAGTTFGEALFAFRASTLIGLAPAVGAPLVNPPMERVIADDDRLIVIASDDSGVRLEERPASAPVVGRIVAPQPFAHRPERTIVLGWNQRAAAILRHLDDFVAPGSDVLVVALATHSTAVGAAGATLRNMRADYRAADPSTRLLLEELFVEEWDHVVIIAPSDTHDAQRADARTLVTLLHLRDIGARSGRHFSIVTEMLDLRNRDLAQVTRVDDFIVSEKLVSQMLAQLAENPALEAVFGVLFDAAGAEIYIRPAAQYVRLDGGPGSDEPVDFFTVVESARRQGQVAIGYRLMDHADDPAQNYGVVLNPDKSEPIPLTSEDYVVVLSEG